MRELTELLDTVLGQTTFNSPSAKNISPAQLRDAFDCTGLRDEEIIEIRRAQPGIPDEPLLQLKKRLRLLLKDYIDPETDHIGHAFSLDSQRTYPKESQHGKRRLTFQPNGLFSIECVSAVEDYAKGLTKGAAVLGAERVTHLLSGWLQGKPVEYRTSALLNGLSVKESFAPMDGIRVEPLPLSTDELPANLPRHRGMSAEDYLGRTVVSIVSTAKPALFHPQTKPSVQNVKVNAVEDMDFDTVCQALSLESDSYADVAFCWNDYQELGAFSLTADRRSWSTGNASVKGRSGPMSLRTEFSTGVTRLEFEYDQRMLDLSETQLARTIAVLKTLKNSHKTRIAVSRWVKSKDPGEHLVDRFIDLRIAFECLYVQDFLDAKQTQELRFKLSLFGAWHLGTDFEERKCIRKKLRQVYDAASKAVHSGDLEYLEYQQLLSTAQNLCRRGILKLLREGPPRDWGDLILGIEGK